MYEPSTDVDVLGLGAMVLRLNSGTETLDRCESYRVHVSGAEFNPLYNLAEGFTVRTGFATAIVPNHCTGKRILRAVPRNMELFSREFLHDGVTGPNHALVFSDAGFGDRGPEVDYDRANEAGAMLEPGDFNWKELFEVRKVKWVHCGGLFASLSDSTTALALEMMTVAKAMGLTTSFDWNYRGKLWARRGGEKAAQSALQPIAEVTDVMIGNEEDLQKSLGIQGPSVHTENLTADAFQQAVVQVRERYPSVNVVATSNRQVLHTNLHNWGMFVWLDGDTSLTGDSEFYEVPQKEIAVLDRIGGGDGACSGLIYCLLQDGVPTWAKTGEKQWSRAEFCARMAWAHGALVATTPGDTTMVHFERVKAYALGGGARVSR